MFAARRATLPCFSHQKAPPRRRSSLFQRSVHAHYENHQAPSIFGCWPFDSIIQSVYWTLRSIQFWLCYQIEELEYDYLDTSIPVISTKPPPLNELAHRTKLDKTWLKYMYAKFKEECPNGLMGLPEFKNVFGRYLSQRVGDAYLERMFFAFAKNGCHDSGENITFEDFVETLAAINEKTAESNAEWVWKIIDANDRGTVNFTEFADYSRSVLELVGREKAHSTSLRPLVKALSVSSFEIQFSPTEMHERASQAFKALDSNESGILSLPDLIDFFQNKRLPLSSVNEKN